MINPDKTTYNRFAKSYNIIPVFKTVPADMETPVSLYMKLTSGRENSFLLESGEMGEEGRYSFIGYEPFLSLYSYGDETVVQEKGNKQWRWWGDSLSALEYIFARLKVHRPQELNFFWGGAVGHISYDLGKKWKRLPQQEEEAGWPSSFFLFPQKVFVYDHRRHLLTAVVLAEVGEDSYETACQDLESCLADLSKMDNFAFGLESTNPFSREEKSNVVEPFSKQNFTEAVKRAKEYISSGDILQVVLSRSEQVETYVSPFTIYRSFRSLNPSPYQFYLSLPGYQVIGASPEMLVKLENGKACTKPIAGTRPRGRDKTEDLELAAELSTDDKEIAEHMMLVDLGRNDLGKVSRYGTIKVEKLLKVEYFSHVMHLVSEVEGQLAPGLGFADLLRAAFPAGTVSGAPKMRAMEIISELEPAPRGPYAGGVGYIGFNGSVDTCIAIRTIFTRSGLAHLQAGAGIVADSDPEKEYEETEHKLAGPMRAVAMAEEWETNAVSNR